MSILFWILGILAYFIVGLAIAVATYIFGYVIVDEPDEDEHYYDLIMTDPDLDRAAHLAGVTFFFWPILLVIAIAAILYMIVCFYISKLSGYIIKWIVERKENAKKDV